MTTVTSYTVETRSQGSLILTDSGKLGSVLAGHLRTLSLDPLAVIPDSGKSSSAFLAELNSYSQSHDLDYVLIVLTPKLAHWLTSTGASFWSALLEVGEGAKFLVAHRPWDPTFTSPTIPPGTRKVILGEYLDRAGEGAPTLDALITEAHTHGTISLPGDGVIDYSLLSLEDLASALAHALIAPSKLSVGLTLANPETISLLSLAHLISGSLSKPVKISFGAHKSWKNPAYNWEQILLTHAKFGIVISGKLELPLQAYLEEFSFMPARPQPPAPQPTRLTPLVSPPAPAAPRRPSSPPPHNLVFVPQAVRRPLNFKRFHFRFDAKHHPLRNIAVRGLVIALALYLGTLAFSFTLVTLHLRSLSRALEARDYTALKLSPLTKFAGLYLDANTVALAALPPFRNLSPVQDAKFLLDVYTQGLSVLETAGNLSASAQLISTYILTDQGGDIAGGFSSARLYSEELYERLSLLDGSLPDSAPALIAKHQARYTTFKNSLLALKKNLITGKALLAAGPNLIALGTKAKYAVLLQNNMELRATGGFIGSLAIISLENGRLYDLALYDVYAADGQLKGHVEPPLPIKEILGEANWYLRDSNYDPDFPTSARRAEWFIKKTLNQDVNGTIAITLDLLKELLKATGPLELPDYQETVTDGNIYERAQYHAEVNFFPGSTAKKEFLSSVTDALFAKVQTGKGVDTLGLISALSSSLDSKNILISLVDPQLEHVFATLAWNGQLADHPCPGNNVGCIKDYLYLVDSNFGVNKANYYVSRKLDLTIEVSKEGILNHTFRALYRNSATSTAWPAGPYKNYARLYLPFASGLVSLKLGNQVLTGNDYTLTEEHGKLVISFLMTVPVNSELVVEARYSTPAPLKPSTLYTWFWQKQPGTLVSDPLTITLNYPLYLKPSVISPSGELLSQQLRFNFTNDTDHRVTVKFQE